MLHQLPSPVKPSPQPHSSCAPIVPGGLTIANRDAVARQRAEWVRQFPAFHNLTAAECAEILAAAHEKKIPRREIIFREGAPCRQVLLVLSGSIKATQVGPTGCEVILRLRGPGELVGALGPYLGTNNWVTASATQATTALVWDAATFESLSGRYPSLRRNTIQLLEHRLRELEERFREVSTQKVPSRLCSQLVRMCNQVRPYTNGLLEINLSREELAQLTGTTLFTVSRFLSKWQKLGIVRIRREAVVVRNLQALTRMSEAE